MNLVVCRAIKHAGGFQILSGVIWGNRVFGGSILKKNQDRCDLIATMVTGSGKQAFSFC